MTYLGRALVYGCNGALGQNIMKKFLTSNWQVLGCDLQLNTTPHSHLVIPNESTLMEQEQCVDTFLKSETDQTKAFLDLIICTSGGFSGGNTQDKLFISKSDEMIKSSIFPSLICSKMASKYLKDFGLLILPGAAPGLEPTPGILSYSASKAYIHYLTKSLSFSNSGLPKGSKVAALAPITLDTPVNRSAMPDSDFNSFTPLEHISEEVYKWSTNPQAITNGAIFKFITQNGKTSTHIF